MSEHKKNDDELGALWQKDSAKGPYMTGTISGVKVVVFKNDRKQEGDNLPTWRVLKSRPKGESATADSSEIPF